MTAEFLKDKRVTAVFAAVAFIGGFILTDKTITGNVISENSASSTLSLIGLGLLGCALLFTLYTIKKR